MGMPLGTVARACWGDDGGETCAATRLESVTNSCRASISWAPRTRSRSRPAGHSGSPSRRVDRRRGQRHRPGYLQCLIGARDSQLIHQYADVVLVAVPGGVDLHRQHVFRRCACHDQAGRVEDGACPIVLGRRHKPPGLLVEPVWVQTCSAAITSAAASTSSFAYSVMSGKAPRGARETLWRRGALGRGLELPSQVPRRSSGSNQLDHLLAERRRVRRSGFRHRGYLLLQQDWVSTEPGQLQLGLLRYESVSHRFRGSSSAGGNVPVLGSTFAPQFSQLPRSTTSNPGTGSYGARSPADIQAQYGRRTLKEQGSDIDEGGLRHRGLGELGALCCSSTGARLGNPQIAPRAAGSTYTPPRPGLRGLQGCLEPRPCKKVT